MGDKNFKWWVGDAEDADFFQGPYDSRGEAVQIGAETFEDGFYVVEADKSVMRASFSEDDIAERIMEQLCDNNEECFGEDGPDGPWDHHPGAEAALEAALRKAVEGWLAEYPGRTFCFGTMRNGGYVKADALAA